jgi:hypothetical protein
MTEKTYTPALREKRARMRRAMESTATFGLLIVAVAMVAPFAGLVSPAWLTAFKWMFASGALIYLAARIVASVGRDESVKVRRLRRLEVWAGLCLAVAAFFWFFNTRGFHGMPTFHMLNETVVFTLAGAVIQVIASWMLSSALAKEQQQPSAEKSDRGRKKN